MMEDGGVYELQITNNSRWSTRRPMKTIDVPTDETIKDEHLIARAVLNTAVACGKERCGLINETGRPARDFPHHIHETYDNIDLEHRC
jgi:hypothetical protein